MEESEIKEITGKKEIQTDLTQEKKQEKPVKLIDILKLVAPGTQLRQAINDIVSGRMGALIVLDNNIIQEIIEKGFKVNCRLTPQRLFELAKMDGAIIVSQDLKKILSANTLLVPDRMIFTSETGTRHKAAERTAKQANTLVIAISEKKRKGTLYHSNIKYALKDTSEILSHATATLQVLEKQRELLNELVTKLNILEINNLVSIRDICSILQRIEIILKISDTIKRDLLELGKEGLIVSMRLKELTKDIDKKEELIIKDYVAGKQSKVKQMLSNLNFDSLLDLEGLSRVIFGESMESSIISNGYRLLSKTSLLKKEIKLLIEKMASLNKILEADKSQIGDILESEEKASRFIEEIKKLKEEIIMEKSI